MYPFTINKTMQNVPFDDQSYPYSPLFNNENQESSNLDSFSSLSSLLHYEDAVYELTWQQLHDVFYQHPTKTSDYQTEMEDLEIIQEEEEDQPTTNHQRTTKDRKRKGNSKADRHSKITTAHGTRDRRMRLSLPVARKFFGLQDLLGYDKASKTIEWLLTQSNPAIERILKNHLQKPQENHTYCSTNGITNSLSSTSECEVMSFGVTDDQSQDIVVDKDTRTRINGVKEKNVVRHARRTTFDPLAKESRKIARERARKRTIEKNRVVDEPKIESLGNFGKGDENRRAQIANNINPLVQYQGLQEVNNLSSLFISSNWNTPAAFQNYHQNEQEYDGSFWQ